MEFQIAWKQSNNSLLLNVCNYESYTIKRFARSVNKAAGNLRTSGDLSEWRVGNCRRFSLLVLASIVVPGTCILLAKLHSFRLQWNDATCLGHWNDLVTSQIRMKIKGLNWPVIMRHLGFPRMVVIKSCSDSLWFIIFSLHQWFTSHIVQSLHSS